MKFSEAQLEQYCTEGYVIVACPFPESLTEACMAAVEKAVPRSIRRAGRR